MRAPVSGVQYSATTNRSFLAWRSIASSHSGKNHGRDVLHGVEPEAVDARRVEVPLPQAATSSRTSWLWKSRSAPIR